MQKFDELKTQGQIIEDSRLTLARLRADWRRELLQQPLYGITCISSGTGHGRILESANYQEIAALTKGFNNAKGQR